MKNFLRQLFLSAAIALFFTLTLAVLAQDQASTPAASPPAETKKPAPPADHPAPAAASAAPAAAPDTNPAAPAEEAAATADDSDEAKPAAEPATAAPSTEKSGPPPASAPKLRRLDAPSTPADEKASRRLHRAHFRHHNGNEVVSVGHNSFLGKDQKADAVVSVFGSSTSEGEVSDSVVSVLGNSKVTGPVGNVVVSVFGNTYVNSKVDDAVVAVFGTVELGPDADVGEVVAVGGNIKRDPKAIVHGEVNHVALGGLFADMEWLRSWFVNCAMRGRLLGFGPHLMWAWWVALGFLAVYVALALLFGKGIDKCVETLEQRPGYSVLSALLTVLLAPVVTILLILTGVGIAAVPFLAAGLFFAGIFGKAVMLAWLGRRLMRLANINHTALAVLVGGVVLLALYTVPILSLVLYKLFGWIGLGVVVYTLVLNMKREKLPVLPVATPPPAAPVMDPATGLPVVAPLVMPPLVAVVTSLPRAGFWIRTAALLLDAVLVGIVIALFRSSGKIEVIALAVYGAVMWKLRGSTIGGIVCGLKVVRLDDRELDWSTAIVRALGCFLSLAVMGLGFIWVAFDDQKQSWHDKIAGTTVVRIPKGVSLV
ncbi:MAG: domain containing protein [Verrucomicrobia bacterium]|nr:domain containing protein [Verrucomicrobiota bacterium]